MPAKMTLAPTFTWPRPPCIQPTVARAKEKMRVVMPAEFIRLPARMKNGTAISGKELMPLTMLARTMIGGMPLVATKASDDSASEIATGTPITMRTSSSRIMTRIDMGRLRFSRT